VRGREGADPRVVGEGGEREDVGGGGRETPPFLWDEGGSGSSRVSTSEGRMERGKEVALRAREAELGSVRDKDKVDWGAIPGEGEGGWGGIILRGSV